jgi:hypothetical protein
MSLKYRELQTAEHVKTAIASQVKHGMRIERELEEELEGSSDNYKCYFDDPEIYIHSDAKERDFYVTLSASEGTVQERLYANYTGNEEDVNMKPFPKLQREHMLPTCSLKEPEMPLDVYDFEDKLRKEMGLRERDPWM